MNVFDILREKLETKKENCTHNQKNFEKCHLGETAIICEAMSKGFESTIEIVNQVEQEYNNGWIPCSERLPDYTDEYNVTVGVASICGYYEKVTTLRYERIKGKEPKWIKPDNEVYVVIAWQPLPEPFRENNIPRKQTNADRIRAMSDEVLADEMLKFTDVCEQINFCHNDQMCNDTLDRGELIEKEMCKRCLLNWLKKEVKE